MDTSHFDEQAATWDDDADKLRRAHEVARAVESAASIPDAARLLEYGAGTGLVTQALLAMFRDLQVTLADNSSGMRQVLEQKIASGALPHQARVWDVDLERQPPPADHFDLIVTSLVLHHVHDLATVLSAFAKLLDPGGQLCIADLDQEDGTFHPHGFDVHHGFDRQELAAALEQAGFVDVTITDCTQIDRDGTAYGVFLAVAQLPGREPQE